MTVKVADPESEVEIAPSQQPGELTCEVGSAPAKGSYPETIPDHSSEEYRLLYLPTMLSVYTARHQQMPTSDESLREHIFGSHSHVGCEPCREETEFLVIHQKNFF
jgi:hypothetical protein